MREDTRSMLTASSEPGAEEWGIFDYEGFEGASIAEYASFDTVAEFAGFISEQGKLGAVILAISASMWTPPAPRSRTMPGTSETSANSSKT